MSMESVWRDGAESFMSIQHLSQERVLHPKLLSLVEVCPGHRLLDYGCGDGRILQKLSQRWEIDAYDPSPQMRAIAKSNVGDRFSRLASTPSEVPGLYDVILLGMVILCIPTKEEIFKVLKDCALRMSESARLFVTTTHPCFRTWHFSNFSTSFAAEQHFEYLADGTPFEVTIRDPGTTGIVFTDYHWTLGFTIKALGEAGLVVTSFIEVPDDPESPLRNRFVPAFLILECRRLCEIRSSC